MQLFSQHLMPSQISSSIASRRAAIKPTTFSSFHSPTCFRHNTSFRSLSTFILDTMKLIAPISAAIAVCALTVSAKAPTSHIWGYRARDKSMVHTSNWNTNWAACGGAHQSPINIVTTAKSGKGKKLPLKFSGRCGQFNLTEPHEPLEVDVAGGATVAFLLMMMYLVGVILLDSDVINFVSRQLCCFVERGDLQIG